MPDLSIGAPGTPDLGTFAGEEPLDLVGDEGTPAGISLPTVLGLVRSAAAIVAQAIGAAYPERPGIGRMTDEEATGIATALVSWSAHNPALRDALERSDALAVAFYAFGWGGRTLMDIAAVRRERKQEDDYHRGEAEVDRPDAVARSGAEPDRDHPGDAPRGGGPYGGGIS